MDFYKRFFDFPHNREQLQVTFVSLLAEILKFWVISASNFLL